MAVTKRSTAMRLMATAGRFFHHAMAGGNKEYLCAFIFLLGCLIVLLQFVRKKMPEGSSGLVSSMYFIMVVGQKIYASYVPFRETCLAFHGVGIERQCLHCRGSWLELCDRRLCHLGTRFHRQHYRSFAQWQQGFHSVPVEHL